MLMPLLVVRNSADRLHGLLLLYSSRIKKEIGKMTNANMLGKDDKCRRVGENNVNW